MRDVYFIAMKNVGNALKNSHIFFDVQTKYCQNLKYISSEYFGMI